MPLFLCTPHTKKHIRSQLQAFLRNRFPTANALTVGAIFDALKGIGYALKLQLLTAPQLKGHLLILHGVHAGEAADGGIQLHHIGSGFAGIEIVFDVRLQSEQFTAEIGLAFRANESDYSANFSKNTTCCHGSFL